MCIMNKCQLNILMTFCAYIWDRGCSECNFGHWIGLYICMHRFDKCSVSKLQMISIISMIRICIPPFNWIRCTSNKYWCGEKRTDNLRAGVLISQNERAYSSNSSDSACCMVNWNQMRICFEYSCTQKHSYTRK